VAIVSTAWISRQAWVGLSRRRRTPLLSRRWALFSWLALTSCFALATASLNRENKPFKARITNHLCYNLDPLLAFGLSCADLVQQTEYEGDLLKDSELRPLISSPQTPIALRERPNIVFFQIESFRADLIGQVLQGLEVVPNINQLARQGTWFQKAYAPASHTSLSNPNIPASLYPLRKEMLVEYRADDPWPKTLIYDVLKPYGYSNAWISSDFEAWCGMDSFLITPALDVFVGPKS